MKQSNHINLENNKQNNTTINGNFLRVKLSGSLLKLSSLYMVEKTWVYISIITIISMFSGLIGVLLLQNTGLYNVGFEAFAQGIARLASFLVDGDIKVKQNIMNALFWSLIIVINIPLIFFGWKKIGKKFTIYTSYYIIVSSLFGLALGFIPNIENAFIFANITPLQTFVNNGVQISIWNSYHDSSIQVALFLYAFMYGFFQAICYSILFILGTSSGGLDFIVVWYAEKKYKNLGTIFTYFNILCFILSYVIGTYIPTSLTLIDTRGIISNIDPSESMYVAPWSLTLLLSPNFVATIFMSIILGITLNNFFPKYQMTKVEIVSRFVGDIKDYIINENKPYSLSIKTIEGGYSGLPQKMLVTNCMYVDAAFLLHIVRKYDPNALFVVTMIKSIDGFVYVAAKEEENIKFFELFRKKKNKQEEIDNSREIEFEIDTDLIDEKIANNNIKSNKKDKEKINLIEASEVFDKELLKDNESNKSKEKIVDKIKKDEKKSKN